VYVQHRLKERAKEINELLQKKAYFYVCGDAANMAREVNTVLSQILADERGISEAKAEEIVKNMRAANQYQVSQVVVPQRPPHIRGVPPCKAMRDMIVANIRLTIFAGGCMVLKKATGSL
jgi:hypothetical protein